jgi:16S rRNA (uracil1498-N3)-methyltransferase
MRLHRFIGDFDLSQDNIEIKDAELINQVSRVLRLKANDQFILSDGNLNEAVAEISEVNKNTIIGKIISRNKNESEAKVRAYLYCAILKRENFELVAQKAVESGIFEIVPLITERTIKTGLNLERLRKIVREAAEQSGRGIVPKLHQAMDFKNVMEHASLNDINVLFDPDGKGFTGVAGAGKIGIFIGPEGGWSGDEIKFAKENNFQIASLGKLTLRAETAAIIASYISVN